MMFLNEHFDETKPMMKTFLSWNTLFLKGFRENYIFEDISAKSLYFNEN